MSALQFITAVIGLFERTLTAMLGFAPLAFFLHFLILAAIYALCRYAYSTTKGGLR